jgi:hypothetical protein
MSRPTRQKRDPLSLPRARAAAGAAAVSLLVALGAAGAAQAAPTFHCEASPLRATIAGTQTVEPITQGRTGDCATGEAIPSLSTPLLAASALTARTTYDGATVAGAATGGVANLSVLPSPAVIESARQSIISAINALPLQPITIPGLPAIPGLPIPGITGLTVDVRASLLSLIPAAAPSLLSADVLSASANVSCQGGVPALSGTSSIAGVKVLGQDLGADGLLNAVLPLIDSRSISLADLDLSQLKFYDPTGVTPIAFGLLGPVLGQITSALGTLPPITIPASLATVTVTPNEQVRDGDTLTQRALHASITLAGQPVLDAVLGEAKVGATAGSCAGPVAAQGAVTPPKPAAAVAGQSVADQLLACSDRKLILVDVLKDGDHVKLLGAANRDYVGKSVAIRLRATGKVVAHAKVAKDGSFETTAPLPPKAYTATHAKANSVRYRAEIGKELSLPLKLQRRLLVSSLTSTKDGKVKITGRVVRPLTTPVATVRVVRRVSCHKVVLVKRFKPNADGTFSITVPAPKGQAAAIYRLATSVREKAGNPRSYPTYTLPRGVALNTR